MTVIKKIIIIYNPNSTGDGKLNAEKLQEQLADVTKTPVTLQPTDFAGHAEKIVQQLPNTDSIMVISSSGDGGYHEVINGALSHGEKASKITTGLLPSGNANDHYHAVHSGDVVKRILNGDVRRIDVLKITVDNDWTRYAHSYAGIGLTPHIGEKLTQATLNPFNEIWLTIRYFLNFRPVKVRTDTGIYRYDSLIFSNIERMSKYLTLSSDAKIDDGKFEITGSKAGTFSKLLKHLFKASTVGLTEEANRASEYSFTSVRPISIQLDGEVFHFSANSSVTVSIAPKALNCII
ncbi:MAG: putative lipid kinase [Candidatus Saccharibacteria bacterium]|nr:putative lipid kinase [Candidatus Saccharibacteria bacterium]